MIMKPVEENDEIGVGVSCMPGLVIVAALSRRDEVCTRLVLNTDQVERLILDLRIAADKAAEALLKEEEG
jgi:hypothetical protein